MMITVLCELLNYVKKKPQIEGQSIVFIYTFHTEEGAWCSKTVYGEYTLFFDLRRLLYNVRISSMVENTHI